MFRKRIVASFLLGALSGAGGTLVVMAYLHTEPRKEEVVSSASVEASIPTRLSIDSVDINATFGDAVGQDVAGAVEVPKYYDRVAWYRLGPTPGETGSAVVLGHVDSESGPEVFHPLKDIKKGDLVKVEREDGSVALFSVYEIDYYSQNNFPTDAVFGASAGAELRLVTCAGVFDRKERRYSHNLVVYTRLLEFRPGGGV